MKKKFIILFTPIFSINFMFILMSGCWGPTTPQCAYPYYAAAVVWDNGDSIKHVPEPAGVYAKALMLEIDVEDTVYTCMRSNPYLPANAAYAYKRSYSRVDSIDSFVLVSNHDFDAAHPSGTDLKDLFRKRGTVKVEQLYSGQNSLYLFFSPSDTGTHTFTLKLFISDSSKNITVTTQPVKLLL